MTQKGVFPRNNMNINTIQEKKSALCHALYVP